MASCLCMKLSPTSSWVWQQKRTPATASASPFLWMPAICASELAEEVTWTAYPASSSRLFFLRQVDVQSYASQTPFSHGIKFIPKFCQKFQIAFLRIKKDLTAVWALHRQALKIKEWKEHSSVAVRTLKLYATYILQVNEASFLKSHGAIV